MDLSPSNSRCTCGRGRRVRWLRWACDDALRAVFPANIRLMKCDNLKALADPCIDCELMIILIDLILQKTRAYHHILFNKLSMWDYLLTSGHYSVVCCSSKKGI
ncbi:hypothetical protein PVAP13_2KG546530 [Panicum virgatum]|uniref:Protein ARV n=1 Tax=Panicum virgatum TaxID=38727 RepID=A0A8T0WP67_PANVG|nr:hypothetical protein PVAP13_2KG546530 [Panicum virgatum]